MRLVIVGMGDTGRELALEMLRQTGQHELVLVDVDPATCARLSESLDALVIEGDGTHPEVLENAQIDRADALVASTGSDATNMVVGMLGRQYGVPVTIVTLVDAALKPACKRLGVTRVITPTVAAAMQIRNVLGGLDRFDVSFLARGGMRLAEVTADGLAGSPLSALRLPPGVLVLAIERSGEVLFPDPGLEIRPMDLLLCLVRDDAAATALKGRIDEG